MKFEELGLHEDILEGIRPMNFDQMTPVQEQTIPVIMEGRDLIGCAQTGTGKTAAYTLPLLERLLREGNPDNVVKSLIVVPTRELARGHDDQRLDHVVGIALPQQPLEQRERISRRLARSRLGAADQVAPLHNHRYGLFLHGSHLVEIHRPDSFQNIFMKPQFFEFHNLAR